MTGVPDPSLSTEEIVCPNGMPAFAAWPAGDGPHPLVILLHERYGLVRHTRDLAMRCARDGFFALAPNIFFRHPDQAGLNAGDARCDIPDPEAVELLGAAVAAAQAHPAADASRLAVAGYCQTGRHPLVYAAHNRVDAVIVWYGAASAREWPANERQPLPLEEVIAALPCPLFAAFGAEDHVISLDNVLRFRNALEAHRKTYEIGVHAGAPHGWLNDTMPGRYRKPQADAAWAAQQRFLARVLGPDHRSDLVTWTFESAIAPDYDFTRNVRRE